MHNLVEYGKNVARTIAFAAVVAGPMAGCGNKPESPKSMFENAKCDKKTQKELEQLVAQKKLTGSDAEKIVYASLWDKYRLDCLARK